MLSFDITDVISPNITERTNARQVTDTVHFLLTFILDSGFETLKLLFFLVFFEEFFLLKIPLASLYNKISNKSL